MELYIVRHGQTIWNKEGRLQGSADIMLNENGINLAKKTGEALKDVYFDKIYSSPLKRAYDTACYIRGDRDIPIVTDSRIKELCFGKLEGQKIEDMKKDPLSHFTHFFDAPHLYVPDEQGETIDALKERAGDFLVSEIEANEEIFTRVMIVAHGAINKALMAHIKQNKPEDFWKGGVQKNCNVIIVRLNQGKYEVIDEEKIFY